jgi:hypothetical protein
MFEICNRLTDNLDPLFDNHFIINSLSFDLENDSINFVLAKAKNYSNLARFYHVHNDEIISSIQLSKKMKRHTYYFK